MNPYFEQIDDYIEGKLSTEDRLSFEAAMAADAKLTHAVENYPLLHKLSASLIEDEVRQQIKGLENASHKVTEVRKVIPMWKYMAAAASVAVVVLAAYFINTEFSTISNEQIVDNLYQRPANSGTRGEEEDINRIDSAVYNFDKNYFDEAKVLFAPRPQNDSLAQLADYYLANMALIEKDYSTSEQLFSSLTTHPKFGQLAQYNLMVIYLLTHQREKAKASIVKLKAQGLLNENNVNFIEKVLK